MKRENAENYFPEFQLGLIIYNVQYRACNKGVRPYISRPVFDQLLIKSFLIGGRRTSTTSREQCSTF